MAEECDTIQTNNPNIDYHIVTLFEKLEDIRNKQIVQELNAAKIPIQIEIRTLQLWKSVLVECIASFIYVFVVCGAAAGTGHGSALSSILLATSLASGFTMTSLTQCFAHISGAHVNPAVSLAMGITKHISVLRTILFIIAQCGGGIAGSAFLYGVTVPGYQGNLSATLSHTANVAAWERFAVEMILTFVVVLTYLISTDNYRRLTGSSAVTIGASYAGCSFVSMPYLNPARSLGPSFVLSRWDNHWIYWLGPAIGSIISALIYDFILNTNRNKYVHESTDGDSSSIHSDEDTYDDLDKPTVPKFHGSTYNTYRPTTNTTTNVQPGYCPSLASASLYSAPPAKLERVESLYGGTKSLYCKSPPLTRANLNRSQSVYTKSNTGVNRDIIPKPGPLVPAQSLYPMRLNQQQNHLQNQNVQNQLHQRSESIYGVRGITPGTASQSGSSTYGTRTNNSNNENLKYEDNPKPTRNRPESMYGMVGTQSRRGQSVQSDDSSYGSYHGNSIRNGSNGNSTYISTSQNTATYTTKITSSNSGTYGCRNGSNNTENRQQAQNQIINTNSSSYHHALSQHSPNSQY